MLKSTLSTTFILGALALIFLSSCSAYRLRTPSFGEKKNFLMSANLDAAILDPLEKGPLNSVESMLSDGSDRYASPLAFVKHQKALLQKDLIRAGYSDSGDDMGPDDEMTGSEKTASVVIAVLVVTGVLIGIAIPILFLLNVF